MAAVTSFVDTDVSLESSCVTLAKGICKRGDVYEKADGTQMSAADRKKYVERETKKKTYNLVAKYCADDGQLPKAERWMLKLEGYRGCNPEVTSFNALINMASKPGDLEKADEWFAKAAEPSLHPELQGLTPDIESYNIMVLHCSTHGDLARAEKYAAEAEEKLSRPSLRSLSSLVRACIVAGQPRRAHQNMQALVDRGCSVRANYSPGTVRACRDSLRSLRKWDVEAFIQLVVELVEALAESRNTITADKWLKYLHSGGVESQEHRQAWEIVRLATPREIVPAVLSGECDSVDAPMFPALIRPATLSGERKAELKLALPSMKVVQARPSSQTSSRPGTSQGLITNKSMSHPSSVLMSPLRANSPALRKMLEVRDRGATPTTQGLSLKALDWSKGSGTSALLGAMLAGS
eukprot:TRINITY_DN17527_c0_g2_i1.p1 TRINITY_DN17527_c0_g2~~TRINITY_DN17527_c0_g2_i1.p1  ORF type:complete len:438 (+),score=73.85 TRINITY_DN17527_c0_g2_i1:90-1316(+)